jgi:hypothetical protein
VIAGRHFIEEAADFLPVAEVDVFAFVIDGGRFFFAGFFMGGSLLALAGLCWLGVAQALPSMVAERPSSRAVINGFIDIELTVP